MQILHKISPNFEFWKQFRICRVSRDFCSSDILSSPNEKSRTDFWLSILKLLFYWEYSKSESVDAEDFCEEIVIQVEIKSVFLVEKRLELLIFRLTKSWSLASFCTSNSQLSLFATSTKFIKPLLIIICDTLTSSGSCSKMPYKSFSLFENSLSLVQ